MALLVFVWPLGTIGSEVEGSLTSCNELHIREARADAANDLADRDVANFEEALRAWRSVGPKTHAQIACRSAAVARVLCLEAIRFGGFSEAVLQGGEWDLQMQDLVRHQQDSRACRNFAEHYIPEQWKPPIWSWDAPWDAVAFDLLSDDNYDSFYSKAVQLARLYGPSQLSREKRVRHRISSLSHLWVLQKVVNLRWEAIKQVVTFGPGSGDSAAALFDLAYRGTHLLVDLPPMVLMQRSWLRLAGVPAYFGRSLRATPDAVRGKIVLESVLQDTLAAHLDMSQVNESVFMATFSFTEADLASREKLRPLLRHFGVIFLAFWESFDDVDNNDYLHRTLAFDLVETHHILSWRLKHHAWAFYLVAVRRNHFQVQCVSHVNCAPSTLHSSFGRVSSKYHAPQDARSRLPAAMGKHEGDSHAALRASACWGHGESFRYDHCCRCGNGRGVYSGVSNCFSINPSFEACCSFYGKAYVLPSLPCWRTANGLQFHVNVTVGGRLWSMIQQVPVDADSASQRVLSDSCFSLAVWLANVMHDLPVGNFHILELGCSLGLPSLVAAWHGAKATCFVFTQDSFALVERNARRNLQASRAKAIVPTMRLQRNVPPHIMGGFDLILIDGLLLNRNRSWLHAIIDALPEACQGQCRVMMVIKPYSCTGLGCPGSPPVRDFEWGAEHWSRLEHSFYIAEAFRCSLRGFSHPFAELMCVQLVPRSME